jgi:hypothetical protein
VAEILINMLADFSMNIMLDPGAPTLEHFVTKNLHCVDHIFCSQDFSPRFSRCEVLPHEHPPKTDHFPIVSVIDLTVSHTQHEPKHDFRDMNWEKFAEELKARLECLTLRDPQDKGDFNAMLEELSSSIILTIEVHVPKKRPSPHQKRWWTKELGQARTALRTLAKKAYRVKARHYDLPLVEEYRQARNTYVQRVKDARTQHWEEWMEATDQFSMWVVNKYVNAPPSNGGSARIPTLKVKNLDGTTREVADNTGKSKVLYNCFFYPSPLDVGVPLDFAYPLPKFQFRNITDAQVFRAIKRLKPYKAPGPDGISNSVFTHCTDVLVPWLGRLFRATFHLCYYLNTWKVYDTCQRLITTMLNEVTPWSNSRAR